MEMKQLRLNRLHLLQCITIYKEGLIWTTRGDRNLWLQFSALRKDTSDEQGWLPNRHMNSCIPHARTRCMSSHQQKGKGSPWRRKMHLVCQKQRGPSSKLGCARSHSSRLLFPELHCQRGRRSTARRPSSIFPPTMRIMFLLCPQELSGQAEDDRRAQKQCEILLRSWI